jgi:RNA recognition motif-containing protein
MNLYVGNLSHDVGAEELRQAFGVFGQVTSAKIITDKITSESRGFGFVDMATESAGQAALQGMTDKVLHGRTVKVSEARRLSEEHPSNKVDNGYRSGRSES